MGRGGPAAAAAAAGPGFGHAAAAAAEPSARGAYPARANQFKPCTSNPALCGGSVDAGRSGRRPAAIQHRRVGLPARLGPVSAPPNAGEPALSALSDGPGPGPGPGSAREPSVREEAESFLDSLGIVPERPMEFFKAIFDDSDEENDPPPPPRRRERSPDRRDRAIGTVESASLEGGRQKVEAVEADVVSGPAPPPGGVPEKRHRDDDDDGWRSSKKAKKDSKKKDSKKKDSKKKSQEGRRSPRRARGRGGTARTALLTATRSL